MHLSGTQIRTFFFSGFLFTTAKVASITAMIYFHITLHPAVHIYDYYIYFTKLRILLATAFIFLTRFCFIPDLKKFTLYKLLLGCEQQ